MKVTSNTDARLAGLVIFMLGLAGGYWFIYLPIAHALNGDPHVGPPEREVGMVPIAMIVGLFLIVFGSEGYGWFQKWPSGRTLILLAIGVFTIIFGCSFGMQFILKSLGY